MSGVGIWVNGFRPHFRSVHSLNEPDDMDDDDDDDGSGGGGGGSGSGGPSSSGGGDPQRKQPRRGPDQVTLTPSHPIPPWVVGSSR